MSTVRALPLSACGPFSIKVAIPLSIFVWALDIALKLSGRKNEKVKKIRVMVAMAPIMFLIDGVFAPIAPKMPKIAAETATIGTAAGVVAYRHNCPEKSEGELREQDAKAEFVVASAASPNTAANYGFKNDADWRG